MTFGRLSTYIRAAAVVLVAFTTCATVRAQEMGKLEGTLLAPDRTAMANFAVHLRWNNTPDSGGVTTGKLKRPHEKRQPHDKWLVLDTDISGRFSTELPAGNWDVFVYIDGYAPTCTIAPIEKGKTTTIDLRLPNYAPMSIE